MGLVQTPTYLVADDVASGQLQVVLADYPQTRGDMWLVRPASRTQTPRLRMFLAFVSQVIENGLAQS